MSSLDGPRRTTYGSPRQNRNRGLVNNSYNSNTTSYSQQQGQNDLTKNNQYLSNQDYKTNSQYNDQQNNNQQYSNQSNNQQQQIGNRYPPQQQQQQQQQQQRRVSKQPNNGKGRQPQPMDLVMWLRQTMARDPFIEPTVAATWQQYFLIVIVTALGVSPEQGFDLMGGNTFSKLGEILMKGVPNSGFFLVKRFCQAMYHTTGHMLKLFEKDVSNNLTVLSVLQNGVLSEDREVSVLLMHIFRNMAHRNKNNFLQENFWGWFAAGNDCGLQAVSKLLESILCVFFCIFT